MNIDLIRKYLANDNNRFMLVEDKYTEDWLPHLTRNGCARMIDSFLKMNQLNAFKDEVLFFAGYYQERLSYARYLSNIGKRTTVDAFNYDYANQRNKLIELTRNLNVRFNGATKEEKPWIESIVIRPSGQNDSLRIDNYALCHDIGRLLMKYYEILPIYDGIENDDIENDDIENDGGLTSVDYPLEKPRAEGKKAKSYIKEFIQETYPFYKFLKQECRLNLRYNKCYMNLIADFIKCIGLVIEDYSDQFEEDYIKNCYKPLLSQKPQSKEKLGLSD